MTATPIARRDDPPPMSLERRIARGKGLRKQVRRSAHGDWSPGHDRPDPIETVIRSNRGRIPELVPLRMARMARSPFDFLRGTAGVMAADLATTPDSGIRVQLCGDAHLGNFGGYASPERSLVFDLNDFDETLPGPWEWDLKRLAASVAVLARDLGLPNKAARAAVAAAADSYRRHIRGYGEMPFLDVAYTTICAEDALRAYGSDTGPLERAFRAGSLKTNARTLPKLAENAGHRFRIVDDPPEISHECDGFDADFDEVLESYRKTLTDDWRMLIGRYRVHDVARKVVGVGSVGLRCYVALLLGQDERDPLFLQFKQARASALEPHLGQSELRHHGRRVIAGERIMQAQSDALLGWTAHRTVAYYGRQLRNMKSRVDLRTLDETTLAAHAGLCAWVLARAHACSGDAAQIAGYLGTGAVFADALWEFSQSYADQVVRDHQAMVDAIASGQIGASEG